MFVLMSLFAFQSSGYNAFAQNQSSPLAGMNFSKSQDVYSKNGFLKTTLVAEYKIGKVGNQTITAMVYNGSLPGPTYHVFPGDKVEIDLVNHLNESTNLHFHGMHVSPANNSDNIFLDVAPGKTQHYTIDIPKNHDPGTNWYHSHLHKLSYGQVSAGLSGVFIVEGLQKLLPKPLQNITQHTFAMRDFPFDNLFVTTNKLSNTITGNERLTVNGEVNPVINIKSGETRLWHLANIGPENELTVELPGHKFYVLAEDGSPVWKVWSNDTLFLPSGKRFDVLVTSMPKKRGRPYTYSPTVILRCFIVRIWFRIDSNNTLHTFLELDCRYNHKLAIACGLATIPCRRTFDRRLKTISTDITKEYRQWDIYLL
jgi:suppressor of ftsI